MGRKPKTEDAPLYNRLPVLRAEHGLSRKDLAAVVGVNYQTIGYLERGDYSPSLDLAFTLAEHFGLPIEAIFSRTPFPPMSQQMYGAPGAGTQEQDR
ncbi:helix-turn-helix transcriptional regulator [Patulibacter minatonensis]|uniref:helix-turn-helix transcriptional regulator n=1 Tax=Patulibacter minatonensis TaxID=298163 RepID=UPI000479DABC|nr:helix-turn-helix transcriptional regulator [Patulibacter minatonensis]